MNELTFQSKLVIVLLLAALAFGLGSVALARARSSLRSRRTDEIEQLFSSAQ